MKYDLHIHSCLSPCGDEDMTPNNIAGMAMLNGLRIAALTDHNSAMNCPAFFKACERVGVVPVAGMELTTAEEIHMICLFPDLESALDFGEYVKANRFNILNRPDIFGRQCIMNENDEKIGEEENLLITASSLDVSAAFKKVSEYGGVAYPAHVDKQSNGIITILGDFPSSPEFTVAEFHDSGKISEYEEKYPALKGLKFISCSDAHYLTHMSLDPPELPINEGNDTEIRQNLIKFLRERH